MKDYGGKL